MRVPSKTRFSAEEEEEEEGTHVTGSATLPGPAEPSGAARPRLL